MVLEYAVHIQGSKPVPPFPHASHFATGCVTKSQPFTYALEWIPCRHVLCVCCIFCTWVARKVEAPERTKRKTLYHNVCKHSSCQFFSQCIHLVLFFRGGLCFFFSLSSVLLECAIDVSRTASYVYFFFHISKGGRQLFFGGVACICGFKIAVCVTLFASSYIISSTTWTSSFCYNSFWFFLSECMCIPSRALLLLKATNLVIPEPDECRLCWSSTHSAVPPPFKMNCTRSKCFYPNLTHLNFEIWPAGRCKLNIDMW